MNTLKIAILQFMVLMPLILQGQSKIRIATYNVALYREAQGMLEKELNTTESRQIQNIAAVIQKTRPDVLVLQEFDYQQDHTLAPLFIKNYLQRSQFGSDPVHYPYFCQFPSNTGLSVDKDINQDGKIALPNDAYGFGAYPGQYAFAVLSRFPLDLENARSFQHFLWKEMPDVQWPENPDGTSYYPEDVKTVFRLSSKNHVDIPVKIRKEKTVHLVIAHPTPPVFDGPEDRNGLRNRDEIRLLADYISGAQYLVDDNGNKGGLKKHESFVIMGDLNADPKDGDSVVGAIQQLLHHPLINSKSASGKCVPKSKGGKLHNQSSTDKGDPTYDTAIFGKRIDYVLPSADLKVKKSGIYWPAPGQPGYEFTKDKAASDHFLVWVDIKL